MGVRPFFPPAFSSDLFFKKKGGVAGELFIKLYHAGPYVTSYR